MFRRMTRERYLSDAELQRLMEVVRTRRHVNQPRDYALFALLANTGIRPSEALVLTRGDVHIEQRPAWIRITRLKKRKTTSEVEDIEVTERLAQILAAHVDTITASEQRLFQVNRRTLQRLYKFFAKRAGLWKGWRLYDLRHTAATRMYLATRDITMVQTMLGHESPGTSTIYAHVPWALLVQTANGMPVFV